MEAFLCCCFVKGTQNVIAITPRSNILYSKILKVLLPALRFPVEILILAKNLRREINVRPENNAFHPLWTSVGCADLSAEKVYGGGKFVLGI